MNNIYPKCTICKETPLGGLYDGMRLAHRIICSSCERQIIEAKIGSVAYQRNIQNIRKILFG